MNAMQIKANPTLPINLGLGLAPKYTDYILLWWLGSYSSQNKHIKKQTAGQ